MTAAARSQGQGNETQEAIVITAAGGPSVLQWRQVPVPSISEDQLLIEVHAAGVNRHDCNQRSRGPTPLHSDVPGLEVAGVVAAVGARVRGWRQGDRVCALTDGGGYARFVATPATHAFAVPSELDLVDAAALPEALFTVWHNFFNAGGLGPGESVLIHGGSSGVGTIAIQFLRALGHPVFATCGSAEKTAIAMRLGAVRAFNYRQDDFVEGVLGATNGRGVDLILDMSGGRYSVLNIRALARRGRLVHLSPGNGADFQVPLRDLMAKEARVTGSLLRGLPDEEKTLIAQRLRDVAWPMVVSGGVRPLIHATLPLADAGLAHEAMEKGEHAGKFVLDCRAR
jgi:NADPH:quinone reductase